MIDKLDRPDVNDRLCVSCKGKFTPWSMGPDGAEPVPPPVDYRCITCRSKTGARA